jgi:hypothetical protein
MAKRRVIKTLSPELAAKMPEVARRVLGNNGNAGASTGPGQANAPQLWFNLYSATLRTDTGRAFFWTYTVHFFASPLASSAIPGMTGEALNTFELENTEEQASGYNIDQSTSPACGAITGVLDCAEGSTARYPAAGRFLLEADGKFYFYFTERNDPIIYG